jgi:hypothetical protein
MSGDDPTGAASATPQQQGHINKSVPTGLSTLDKFMNGFIRFDSLLSKVLSFEKGRWINKREQQCITKNNNLLYIYH